MSPGTVVTDSCEPPLGCWESHLCPLEGIQLVILIAVPAGPEILILHLSCNVGQGIQSIRQNFMDAVPLYFYIFQTEKQQQKPNIKIWALT